MALRLLMSLGVEAEDFSVAVLTGNTVMLDNCGDRDADFAVRNAGAIAAAVAGLFGES